MVHISIIGDSFVGCLKGCEELAEQKGLSISPVQRVVDFRHKVGTGFLDVIYFEKQPGKFTLEPRVAAAIRQSIKDTPSGIKKKNFVFSFGGTAYSRFGLHTGGVRYDYYHPRFETLTDVDRLLPLDLIKAGINAKLTFVVPGMRLLKESLDGDVFFFLSPPPARDKGAFASFFERQQAAGRHVTRKELVDDQVNLKNWSVMTDILQDAIEASGCKMITPPKSTIGEDGFLKPAYSRDIIHGNNDFGRIQMESIIEACLGGASTST